MTYDDWRLSGPHEDECDLCNGTGLMDCMACGGDGDVDDCGTECPACEGAGHIECECREEPDGDYEYERRRDAAIDRG